jgi:hypothetical protein
MITISTIITTTTTQLEAHEHADLSLAEIAKDLAR